MSQLTTLAHPSNAEQAAAWNGDQGAYWTAHARRFDAAVERYQQPLFDAAALRRDSRVLDIGCGTGHTTREAARRCRDGEALGVDLSADMITLARELTSQEQIGNAHFLLADAQHHRFDRQPFDVVISRTGTMFFGRPTDAFENIARALRPAGRLVMMTWQPAARNEWMTTFAEALTGHQPPPSPANQPGPFSLSDPEHVRRLLHSSGFTDVAFDSRVEPMFYGHDTDDAFDFVIGLLGWMIRDLDDVAAAAATARLRRSLDERATPAGVQLGSAAWIITAHTP